MKIFCISQVQWLNIRGQFSLHTCVFTEYWTSIVPSHACRSGIWNPDFQWVQRKFTLQVITVTAVESKHSTGATRGTTYLTEMGFWKAKSLFFMWSWAWAVSAAGKRKRSSWDFGDLKNPASVQTSDTRDHKQRQWEKEVEREAGRVISSTLHPGHLTLLLIVCLNKGGRQRWCCSIDRLVMGAMKGPRVSEWDS